MRLPSLDPLAYAVDEIALRLHQWTMLELAEYPLEPGFEPGVDGG